MPRDALGGAAVLWRGLARFQGSVHISVRATPVRAVAVRVAVLVWLASILLTTGTSARPAAQSRRWTRPSVTPRWRSRP